MREVRFVKRKEEWYTQLNVIPGAEETLRELKARGYRMVPETEEETPEYRIEEPLQLLELVERLENMV